MIISQTGFLGAPPPPPEPDQRDVGGATPLQRQVEVGLRREPRRCAEFDRQFVIGAHARATLEHVLPRLVALLKVGLKLKDDESELALLEERLKRVVLGGELVISSCAGRGDRLVIGT